MNCKAVFFDLDDTLCHAAQAWRKAEQDTFDSLMLYSYPGLTELDARRAWESVQQDLFTQLDNHLLLMADLRDIRFQKTLDELNISDLTLADELNKQLSTKRLSYLTLCDGVIDTLTTLRSRYHIGIITNGAADEHPDSQYAAAKQLNLFPYIDSFWVSDEIGYRKPETEIFQCALNPIGLQAHEAVFVENSLSKDIAGANRTGMVSVLIATSSEPPILTVNEERPDYIIRHLSELNRIV
jgi:putative hydrolase of the HAD superfamily